MCTAFENELVAVDRDVTDILVVRILERSRDFYLDVLGAEVYREYGHHSVIVNCLGRLLQLMTTTKALTDKPDVVFEPPGDRLTVSNAIIIGVTDCRTAYDVLRARGADFLTPPVQSDLGTCCSFRDPDGHLVEIRETRPD